MTASEERGDRGDSGTPVRVNAWPFARHPWSVHFSSPELMRVSLFLVLVALSLVLAHRLPIQRRRIIPPVTDSRLRDTIPFDGGPTAGGEWLIQVSIGKPASPHWLIFDTGSADNAVVSSACTGCASRETPYDPKKSSTATLVACNSTLKINCTTCAKDTCQIATSYLDGNYGKSNLYTDTFTVGSLSTEGYIGAYYDEKGMTSTQRDGIAGFAYSTVGAGAPTFMDSLVQANLTKDLFSVCMGQEDGEVNLGEIAYNLASGPINYLPLEKPLSYYLVRLNSITAGSDTPIQIPTDTVAAVDTGTTFTLLPQSVFTSLSYQFIKQCTSLTCFKFLNVLGTGQCVGYKKNKENFSDFPILTFDFGGFQVKLKPEHYIYRVPKALPAYDYCATIGLLPMQGNLPDGRGLFILGSTFLKAVLTVFDREKQQVGFAKVGKCGTDLPLGGKTSVADWMLAHPVAVGFIASGITAVIVVPIVILVLVKRHRRRQMYAQIQ